MKTTLDTPTKTDVAPREMTPAKAQYVIPSVDVQEAKDEYLLEADMPGVDKNDIEVLLENSELRLVGRRREQPVEGTWLHRESRGLDYRRTFELDPIIDTNRISASIEHGVLRVRLPKAEQVKPRRIKISE